MFPDCSKHPWPSLLNFYRDFNLYCFPPAMDMIGFLSIVKSFQDLEIAAIAVNSDHDLDYLWSNSLNVELYLHELPVGENCPPMLWILWSRRNRRNFCNHSPERSHVPKVSTFFSIRERSLKKISRLFMLILFKMCCSIWTIFLSKKILNVVRLFHNWAQDPVNSLLGIRTPSSILKVYEGLWTVLSTFFQNLSRLFSFSSLILAVTAKVLLYSIWRILKRNKKTK